MRSGLPFYNSKSSNLSRVLFLGLARSGGNNSVKEQQNWEKLSVGSCVGLTVDMEGPGN